MPVSFFLKEPFYRNCFVIVFYRLNFEGCFAVTANRGMIWFIERMV